MEGRDRRRATTTSPATAGSWRCCPSTTCQGWLEGYLLTGRHGLFNCYEAFIHIVDSMFNQHAKWLKVTREHPVAPPDRVAQLPAHLARLAPGPQRLLPPGPGLHRPRGEQEGRGRPRLPAARRQHACCRSSDHCLRSRDYVNVIVAGKQPAPNWLTWTRRSCTAPAASASGTGPSNDGGGEPDVVLACAGDVPTLEDAGRRRPAARAPARAAVRVVNVVDLMRLQADDRAPARPVRPRVRRAVHHRQAGDLRLPRLPVADPPAHLPAHQPRATCTCAATRRRAPPPRRSTW